METTTAKVPYVSLRSGSIRMDFGIFMPDFCPLSPFLAGQAQQLPGIHCAVQHNLSPYGRRLNHKLASSSPATGACRIAQ
ncbi:MULTISPECIES: hypothetical protein [unclassified Mesorhizobium]|uniref:hypothetical protein n=1 Tax=unclassified Mesorhizobium TaxID=325217 RepID=UPI0015E41E03|nr:MULTISPECIES: hypothetical protein [unclassified Mesorhizobium]